MEVIKSIFLKAALLPGMPEETAGAVPPQESEIAPEVLEHEDPAHPKRPR